MRSIWIRDLGGRFVFFLLHHQDLVALGFSFFFSSSNLDIIDLKSWSPLVEYRLSCLTYFVPRPAPLVVEPAFPRVYWSYMQKLPSCRGAWGLWCCNGRVRSTQFKTVGQCYIADGRDDVWVLKSTASCSPSSCLIISGVASGTLHRWTPSSYESGPFCSIWRSGP